MKEASRHRRTAETAATEAALRLTDRDRAICEALYEHRVLTTEQLRQLHFDSDHRARKRLLQLHRLGVLDRFRPYRQTGSHPYHYLLDQLGAAVVASERGVEPGELDWTRAKALKLAASTQLRHLVEANGFFTRLIGTTGARRDLEVVAWWGQRRCGQAWGQLVRPDGYCALATGRGVIELCLEWDRGTEPLTRIDDKLARYAELHAALERRMTVAIVAPSERRERELLRALRPRAAAPVLITTAERHQADPLAANWITPKAETRASLEQLACGAPGTAASEPETNRPARPEPKHSGPPPAPHV